jgi:hypothetical protein
LAALEVAYLRHSHHTTAQIANTAIAIKIGVSIMRVSFLLRPPPRNGIRLGPNMTAGQLSPVLVSFRSSRRRELLFCRVLASRKSKMKENCHDES